MKQSLIIIQIITAVITSVLILMQAKGTGLGRTFGSQTYHSKRGIEFVVFRLTIIMAILFVLVSIVSQLL